MRYRDNAGTTWKSLQRFDRAVSKLGQLSYVRGYRYKGKYGIDEAVIVRGVNGTARFSGLLWGYGGEGPRGLHEILLRLGLTKQQADSVAFNTPRNYPVIGEDWRVVWRPIIQRRLGT